MNFPKKTIRDVPIEGKTVLLRADYNVPQKEDGTIHDDFRIRASLPTIRRLLKDGCKVVIVAHLGRPEGEEEKYSLEQVGQRLAELLKEPVRFVDKTTGEKVRMAVKRAPKRSVTLLENLRFHPEEEANDEAFSRKLARDSGAHYFVQDGFGVVHREHASTSAITRFLPSVAGLLLEKEYVSIVGAMSHPVRPLVAVMGGAKVSDKIAVIDELVNSADQILIGGAMANTFLYERGFEVGKSKFENDQGKTVRSIYKHVQEKVGRRGIEKFLVLPEDVAVATSLDSSADRRTRQSKKVQPEDIILDIGEKTMQTYVEAIQNAGTIIWNGTMGMAEYDNFADGSEAVATAIVGNEKGTGIVGGGDTADFVLNWDARHGGGFSHVSTGGGAGLELMAGEKLPGIELLLDA